MTAAATTSAADANTAGEGQPHRHSQPRRKEQRESYDDAGKPAEVNGVERLQRLQKTGEKAGILGRQIADSLPADHRCASPQAVRKSASMLAVTK